MPAIFRVQRAVAPWLSLGALWAATAMATPARAEPFGLHVSGGGALAVGGYQQREFGPGAELSTAIEYRATPGLALTMQLEGLLLSDGAEPTNPELANNNGASLGAALLGGNFAFDSGVWVGVNGGCGITAGRLRPVMTATLGYDLAPAVGATTAWGPMVKWLHLFQADSGVRPEDANVIIAGVHVLFGTSSEHGTRSAITVAEHP